MKTGEHDLTDNLEDYLETILLLEKEKKVARVKDISEKTGVVKGTVTVALRTLAKRGLVNYEPYAYITLTSKGNAIAEEITRRHGVIKNFLKHVLLLDEESAEDNACRMEHGMDKEAVDRLVQFIEYIHHCPRTGDDWINAFVNYYTKNVHDKKQCQPCMQNCMERFEQETE